MNKGVEILLARMESNPEEFVPDVNGRYPRKWRDTLLQDSVDTLTLQKDLNDTYWKAYGATTVLPITPPRELSSLLQQADCGSPKEKP